MEENNDNNQTEQIDSSEQNKNTEISSSSKSAENEKSRGCFWVITISIISLGLITAGGLCLIIFMAMMSIDLPSLPTIDLKKHKFVFDEEYVYGDAGSKNKIAIIDIEGIILQESNAGWGSFANADDIIKQLRYISEDPGYKAVVVKLNTPGGEVVASDVIYHEIKKLRQKRKIPIVASMGTVAASGGYYVAVACNHIVANRLTITGSIGVIIQAYDYFELFKKVGLKAEVYKSGPMKDMLNGSRPRTPAEKIIVQELVDQTYDEFVKLVAAGRKKLTVEKIKDSIIGDGRVFHGCQAMKLGLIDELGFFEDALDKAAELAGKKDYRAVRLKKQFSLAQFFAGAKSNSTGNKVQIQLPGQNRWNGVLEPWKLYFLPTAW